MALRTIRKDDDPILRKRSREITKFDERLKALADDMIETMIDADGLGIAAPQVGILKRIIIIDDCNGEGAGVYVNPEILSAEGEQYEVEGCLSFPGIFGRVKRPAKVKVKYQDLDGKEHHLTAEETCARAFSHEIDHLNGVVFLDKAELLTAEELREMDSEE